MFSEKMLTTVDRAIVGDPESERATKIDLVAGQVARIVTDEAARRNAESKLRKIIWDLGRGGEWRTDSFSTLIDTTNDPNRVANKDLAMERLDILATATYIALGWGGNRRNTEAIQSGLSSQIMDVLPEPMKNEIFAERVRNVAITNPDVRRILDEFDRRNLVLVGAGEGARDLVESNIRQTINMLVDVKCHSKKDGKDILRVVAYLGSKIGPSRESSTVSEHGVAATKVGDQTGARRARFGDAEGMNTVAPIPIPSESLDELEAIGHEKEGAKRWMVSTLVRMSENPLFFANWWQQGMADQITSMITDRLGYSSYSQEYAEIRDFGYAVLSVLGIQAVDRNADANSDSYGQFSPPKGMAGVLHWDDGGKNCGVLRSNPEMFGIYSVIYDIAFNKNQGWRVVEAFSDGKTYDSQNKFLRWLLSNREMKRKLADAGVNLNQTQNTEAILNSGRVALAMFEVDLLPEWIRWANESKRAFAEGRQDEDLPWLQAFTREQEINHPEMASYNAFAYAGKMQSIVDGRRIEIGYDHPRIIRPWDVAAGAKGSYRSRPEIIFQMERVMGPFLARRLSTPRGNWVRASGHDIGAENVLDRYLKYGKLAAKLFGGPQAAEFDNLTSMDEILPLAANFWGPEAHGSTEFGKFLEDLFALKAEAMFYPGYRSSAKITLAAIAGLDVFSGEAEKKKALEGAIGPNGNFAHGWVAEVRRLYGIDLLETVDPKGEVARYPKFFDAYVRVFMDTPDLDEARKTYQQARNILAQNQYFGVAAGVFSIAKMLTGSK